MMILSILSFLSVLVIKNKHFMSMFILIFCPSFIFKFSQFVDNTEINEILSMNKYSYMLLMMTYLILGLIFMFFNINDFEYFKLVMLILLGSLTVVFMAMNLLVFYFMYEVSLIMMFLIIMKWGLGSMRLIASFYLLYYSMFFSLPFLLFIMDLNYNYNVSMIYFMEMLKINYLNWYMFMFFMFTFFVKVPIYTMHSWLLKAHVEAPVIGSMILAGILLKLGVYGLIRFMMIFTNNFMKFNSFISYLSIFGAMVISIYCIRQVDMKILVAYSSIVHMGIMLSSMMTFMNFSMKGSYMMMIAHGLCSSGMFFLVNLSYLMSNSRLMMLNKGLINIYPSMSLMWFLLCSSNLSAPMSLNLVSEIMLMISLLNWNILILMILMFLMFFSFLYSLNLFSFTQHGEFNIFQNLKGFNMNDYLILLFHWIPLNLFIFNMLFFL